MAVIQYVNIQQVDIIQALISGMLLAITSLATIFIFQVILMLLFKHGKVFYDKFEPQKKSSQSSQVESGYILKIGPKQNAVTVAKHLFIGAVLIATSFLIVRTIDFSLSKAIIGTITILALLGLPGLALWVFSVRTELSLTTAGEVKIVNLNQIRTVKFNLNDISGLNIVVTVYPDSEKYTNYPGSDPELVTMVKQALKITESTNLKLFKDYLKEKPKSNVHFCFKRLNLLLYVVSKGIKSSQF